MVNRILSLLLGISLILYGFFTIIQRAYYSSKFDFYFDFGPYHYLFGIFITIIGALFVYIFLTRKAKDFEDKFLVCPQCKTLFDKKDVPNGRCPHCEVALEDLERFYESHPELNVPDDKKANNSKNGKTT
ncbi:MAG: hypothetical protein DRJ18_01370 [Candidatus Methanomethylicota archaeon]|nr:MAG: hypothetical protein DRJ18_01370 [Candidatus Verstraetearchaeota archaeon]